MPLIHGYTEASIHHNVATLMHEGRPQGQAVAIALREARAAWRHAHPHGSYPAHLKGTGRHVKARNRSGETFRKGEVVGYRPNPNVHTHLDFDPGNEDRYVVVTGRPSMRLWEGIGWTDASGRTVKEPHLYVRNEDGGSSWIPVRSLRKLSSANRSRGCTCRDRAY